MGSDLEVNIKVELSGQDIKEWTSGPRVLEKKHVDKKKVKRNMSTEHITGWIHIQETYIKDTKIYFLCVCLLIWGNKWPPGINRKKHHILEHVFL